MNQPGVTPEGVAARLRLEAAAVGVDLTPRQARQLQRYLELVGRWRRAAALTAVANPLVAARVHIADSLLCLRAGISSGARVIDVGSGAGLPGIPLAVARPDVRVTLLEANRKKAAFLERAVAELGLSAAVVVGRAEDAGGDARLREVFDVVTARAVAPLPVLIELTLPLAAVGGLVVLLKGPRIDAELAAAAGAIEMLGGGAPSVVPGELAGGEQRSLVVIRKRRPTPDGFPRRSGVPRRRPIG